MVEHIITLARDAAMTDQAMISPWRKDIRRHLNNLLLAGTLSLGMGNFDSHAQVPAPVVQPQPTKMNSVTSFEINGSRYNLAFEDSNPNLGVVKSVSGQDAGRFNFFIYPDGASILRITGQFPGLTGEGHFFLANRGRTKITYMASSNSPSLLKDELALNQGLWSIIGKFEKTQIGRASCRERVYVLV